MGRMHLWCRLMIVSEIGGMTLDRPCDPSFFPSRLPFLRSALLTLPRHIFQASPEPPTQLLILFGIIILISCLHWSCGHASSADNGFIPQKNPKQSFSCSSSLLAPPPQTQAHAQKQKTAAKSGIKLWASSVTWTLLPPAVGGRNCRAKRPLKLSHLDNNNRKTVLIAALKVDTAIPVADAKNRR